ncbi:MAG: class I SAM-dependent methyltransferase [Candidatus Saelkia tenebricola]|nr:class I SAM-dependent methyltransferase [Candidatus Saelkia tenebricola]
MNADIKKWLEKGGELFLRKIGLKEEQTVLDFGSGVGHYTIPAAKIVGNKSKVYAFDKDKNVLSELEKTARRFNLKNIELINGDTKVSLEENSIDVVLCYDVVHYMKNRTSIYDEAYRVLKAGGFFSLYPKHHKDDYPLMELASLQLGTVIKEVEKSGFILKDKLSIECLHDDYYNECSILNFTLL